jgi:hypothetical protein
MGERIGWMDDVYHMLEDVFHFSWNAHLHALNEHLRLRPEHRFSTHGPSEPPTFFNGDIEALQPGRWILVVSLNPHQVKQPVDRHFATFAEYWNFWRTYNCKTWYPGFYRPLTRVAAGAMRIELSLEDERTFATTQMLFLELCPYASPRFDLAPERVKELVAGDPGFRIARRILQLAAGEGHPALILVNGNAAVESLSAVEGGRIEWSKDARYPSESKQGKRLHHREGSYETALGSVPVAGFPFLHTRQGHNSYVEIAQLASHLHALISPTG